jgi:hypothetical protein
VDELPEQALAGGRRTHGIVRVGQAVRRSLHQRSDYVHALLRHLEAVGFDGAPRLLGIDAQGREVLTCLPGEVVVRSPAWLPDARLDSAARLIRRFHDATAGTPLAGDRFRRARDGHARAGRAKGAARDSGRRGGCRRCRLT